MRAFLRRWFIRQLMAAMEDPKVQEEIDKMLSCRVRMAAHPYTAAYSESKQARIIGPFHLKHAIRHLVQHG